MTAERRNAAAHDFRPVHARPTGEPGAWPWQSATRWMVTLCRGMLMCWQGCRCRAARYRPPGVHIPTAPSGPSPGRGEGIYRGGRCQPTVAEIVRDWFLVLIPATEQDDACGLAGSAGPGEPGVRPDRPPCRSRPRQRRRGAGGRSSRVGRSHSPAAKVPESVAASGRGRRSDGLGPRSGSGGRRDLRWHGDPAAVLCVPADTVLRPFHGPMRCRGTGSSGQSPRRCRRGHSGWLRPSGSRDRHGVSAASARHAVRRLAPHARPQTLRGLDTCFRSPPSRQVTPKRRSRAEGGGRPRVGVCCEVMDPDLDAAWPTSKCRAAVGPAAGRRQRPALLAMTSAQGALYDDLGFFTRYADAR